MVTCLIIKDCFEGTLHTFFCLSSEDFGKQCPFTNGLVMFGPSNSSMSFMGNLAVVVRVERVFSFKMQTSSAARRRGKWEKCRFLLHVTRHMLSIVANLFQTFALTVAFYGLLKVNDSKSTLEQFPKYCITS